jgi:hypothetical protein
LSSLCKGRRLAAVVLFLGRRLSPGEQALLDQVLALAEEEQLERVCVVSTYRIHFGDRDAVSSEARVVERLNRSGARAVLFRPSRVLSPNSCGTASLRALWFCHPLVPRRFTTCWVQGNELFTAMQRELTGPVPRRGATYTLLGPNRPWRDVLREHADNRVVHRCLAAVAFVLGLLCVGRVAGLLLTLYTRLLHGPCPQSFDTLCPQSHAELLALYNKYNHQHVKVVGYNNGVVHFGQRYPERTVLTTTRCNRRARVTNRGAEFDVGVTVRQAIDVLRQVGKELYVVPNYSYVCLGTTFFVPIHGSSSDFSTMGDTITRVLLYDPLKDRLITAARGDAAFAEHAYNLESPILLLRLHVQVREMAKYYMERTRLERPTGAEVLAILQENRPSNVEIRKLRAADQAIDVCRYFTQAPNDGGSALPLPRDSIGRLWDKLEANPVSSVLFHGFNRRFIYHVELFVPTDEFAAFWDTHCSLPLLKVQLRYIKRDGMRHSPFRERDCVSVDVLMRKKHKQRFDTYVKENFRAVQFNPGKHSM